MKIKKKVCTALAVCAATFLTGVTAFAQITEVSCDMNYGVITFRGTTDALGQRVTYTASRSDSADILSINEPEVQEDGSFAFEVGFETSGDYKIIIKDAGGATYEKTITGYQTLSDRKDFLLNQINTGGETEIKAALDEVDFSFYDAKWSSNIDTNLAAWILRYMQEHRTYADMGETETEYAKLNALYIINKAKIGSIASEVGTYAQMLGIQSDSQITTFLTGTTNLQKSTLVLALSNNPATTPQMLKDAIKQANDAQASANLSGGTTSGGGGGGSFSGGSSGGGGGIVKVEKDDASQSDAETKPEESKPEVQAAMFSDLTQAEWAKEAVEALAKKKVISGYDDGTFKPNANVTREEFVKMVVVAFGIPYEGKGCAFLDVFEDDWFKSYVGAAQEYGIITGISDDIFGIHKEITRQDAAVILKRAADYTGIDLGAVRKYEKFKDHNAISDYACDAIEVLYRHGTINGKNDGYFAPQDTCTRAETAKMIYGMMKGGAHE